MELNVFEYFKDYRRTTNGPMTPEEQGTSLFLAGNMGSRSASMRTCMPPRIDCRVGISSGPRPDWRPACWP